MEPGNHATSLKTNPHSSLIRTLRSALGNREKQDTNRPIAYSSPERVANRSANEREKAWCVLTSVPPADARVWQPYNSAFQGVCVLCATAVRSGSECSVEAMAQQKIREKNSAGSVCYVRTRCHACDAAGRCVCPTATAASLRVLAYAFEPRQNIRSVDQLDQSTTNPGRERKLLASLVP